MVNHEQKIAKIADQLKRHDSTKPLSIKKKAVSHEVPKPNDKKHSDEKIDVSDLNESSIDSEKRICVAEPGVTFSDLVKATLKHNLVPVVCPNSKPSPSAERSPVVRSNPCPTNWAASTTIVLSTK